MTAALLKESSHLHEQNICQVQLHESKISLRSNERDLADAGPRIFYALMTQ